MSVGSMSRRTAPRVTPPHQYDPYAPQLGYISESIHRLLSERECGIFDRGLADYHRRRNVRAFVETLSLVLNSTSKRQLLIPIRDAYVKACDVAKFNQLVQAHGLATSLRRRKKEEAEQKRRIEVKRAGSGEWGFNIRGGIEFGTGVYVSWVEPASGAYRSGMRIGDQILKANGTNFESISHYDAAEMIKGNKRLQLWVLSRGVVPGSRMAHKVYRWVDPQGRPTTPPPDPYEVSNHMGKGPLTEADERRVTLILERGQELGLSIRGGAEHGLGVYISALEQGSVSEDYGLKVGDQILEVNGISFLGIVHADAANALKAQPTMVMKVKDVGKLPHSRITTYGQTQWYSSPNHSLNRSDHRQGEESVFLRGAGTQVMHRKQDRAVPGKGILWEVAQSVLTSQELTTFTYYIQEYEHRGLAVEDLVAPLLQLLNSAEKIQLLSEVRGLIRARDLGKFNELTVHKEMAARKASKKPSGLSSMEGSLSSLSRRHHEDGKVILTNYVMQPTLAPIIQDPEDPTASNLSFASVEQTLIPVGGPSEVLEEGGRDKVPQRQSPTHKITFHTPPPPSSPPNTSTPEGSYSSDPQTALADTLRDRRRYMRPGEGLREHSTDETWDEQWSDATLSSIQPRQSPHGPQQRGNNTPSDIEKVRRETEAKLRLEYEEKQRNLEAEQHRRIEQERRQREEEVLHQKEELEHKMREIEERAKQEVEAKIRREAEEDMSRRLKEKERQLAEEHARNLRKEELKRQQREKDYLEEQLHEVERRTKEDMEEKIWREAEEHIRQEFDERLQRETEQLQSRQTAKQKQLDDQMFKEMKEKILREAEKKYRQEFDQKLEKEVKKRKEFEEAEKQRIESMEKKQREEMFAHLEAEEQARFDLEERIRKEAEEKARSKYEERLRQELSPTGRGTEEPRAHQYSDEPLEQPRRKVGPPTHPKPQSRAKERQQQLQNADIEFNHSDEEREEFARAEQERRRRDEYERKAEEEDRQIKQAEAEKKLELQRKREENIRRREEERKQKQKRRKVVVPQQADREAERQQETQQGQREVQEQRRRGEEAEAERRQAAEQRRREEEAEAQRRQAAEQRRFAEEEEQRQRDQEKQRDQQHKLEHAQQRREEEEARERQQVEERQRREQEQRKQRDTDRKTGFNVQHVKVNFGSETAQVGAAAKPKTKQQLIEEERQLAEEKLKKRIERARKADEVSKKHNVQLRQPKGTAPMTAPAPAVVEAVEEPEGRSFGGYTGLEGDIRTVVITKVVKRLGIAIDGGANTRQKAVIIREISEGGSAALSGQDLCIGQQILAVGGTSLYGLRHKEAVMAIKTAFEGPLEKKLEIVVHTLV